MHADDLFWFRFKRHLVNSKGLETTIKMKKNIYLSVGNPLLFGFIRVSSEVRKKYCSMFIIYTDCSEIRVSTNDRAIARANPIHPHCVSKANF